ncbi:MAG: hypothetical protein ACYDA3_08150 [Gaiellaceae bacterium]
MPKRKPEPELLKAIRHHAARMHRLELAEAEIAYEGRKPPSGAKVLFRPGSELAPAWFRCLFCQPGFDRYRADLYVLRPPAWALARIREHFAAEHGIPELPRGWIFTQGGDRSRARCDWQPATEYSGASFYCYLCPEAHPNAHRNYHLEDAPYGDARRLREVMHQHPELWSQTRGIGSAKQADEVELVDRGLQAAARGKSVKRVLAEARGEEHQQPLTPIILAWRGLLLEEVRTGSTPKEAIASLMELQRGDPVGFRCRIGEHMPDMKPLLNAGLHGGPEAFAKLVVSVHGFPERRERAIWSFWSGIAKPERDAAEAAGRR